MYVCVFFFVSVHDAIIKVNNKKINSSLKFNVKREWNFIKSLFISYFMTSVVLQNCWVDIITGHIQCTSTLNGFCCTFSTKHSEAGCNACFISNFMFLWVHIFIFFSVFIFYWIQQPVSLVFVNFQVQPLRLVYISSCFWCK